MALRQSLGIVLGLISVVYVTRVIGPAQYGYYAAGAALVYFFQICGTLGVDVFLLRKETAPLKEEYSQAFTILLFVGVTFGLIVWVSSNPIARVMKLPETAKLMPVMAIASALSLLNLPQIVQLDRELRFKRVAIIELCSQSGSSILAVILARAGVGAWAPTFALAVQQVFMVGLAFASTPVKPRITWNSTIAKEMLSYGLQYWSSNWIWQAKGLINPLIVGRLAGPSAVGAIALAVRFCETLTFVKTATWRIALAAMAKIGSNRPRLAQAIGEGMRLQAIAVGLPLIVFAIAGRSIVAHVFGPKWDSSLPLVPMIGVGYLANAMFNLHCSALYIQRRIDSVMKWQTVYLIIFALSAMLFVSRYGNRGYGMSEIAATASYFLLYSSARRFIGQIKYKGAAIWFIPLCLTLLLSGFIPTRPGICLLLIAPFLVEEQRAWAFSYLRLLFRTKREPEILAEQR